MMVINNCTFLKSLRGPRVNECLHWNLKRGTSLTHRPCGDLKGRADAKRKHSAWGIEWVLSELDWYQSKDSLIWSPLCTTLYCLSSYTYTHLGFTECGTETFNINAIPGRTEEWLLEHCQSTLVNVHL